MNSLHSIYSHLIRHILIFSVLFTINHPYTASSAEVKRFNSCIEKFISDDKTKTEYLWNCIQSILNNTDTGKRLKLIKHIIKGEHILPISMINKESLPVALLVDIDANMYNVAKSFYLMLDVSKERAGPIHNLDKALKKVEIVKDNKEVNGINNIIISLEKTLIELCTLNIRNQLCNTMVSKCHDVRCLLSLSSIIPLKLEHFKYIEKRINSYNNNTLKIGSNLNETIKTTFIEKIKQIKPESKDAMKQMFSIRDDIWKTLLPEIETILSTINKNIVPPVENYLFYHLIQIIEPIKTYANYFINNYNISKSPLITKQEERNETKQICITREYTKDEFKTYIQKYTTNISNSKSPPYNIIIKMILSLSDDKDDNHKYIYISTFAPETVKNKK